MADMPNVERFTFAGFNWPLRIAEFHRSRYNVRKLRDGREVPARMRFDYYHAPKPLTGPGDHGRGFYMDSDGAPSLRWQWCDEVFRAIDHRGWWTDRHGDGEKIRGVVFRLPRGRGFLAGHSMGEGMATTVEYRVFEDERDAARAADRLAEIAAECEREYQEAQEAEHGED